jgi:uncharacterized protein (DUF2147 family)
MKKLFTGAAAALLTVSALGTAATAASAAQPTGVWRNPKNSVHVRVQPCGSSNVCGTVVWANARAQEKARKAGTPNLVGKQLFQEFRPTGDGSWDGKVLVPDLAKTVSGQLHPAGPNAIVAKGCLLGRVLCKTQTWTRLS